MVRAVPLLMQLWQNGVIPKPELERQARGVARLKEVLSSTPFYVQRAQRAEARRPGGAMDYWYDLYSSRINW